MTREQVVALLTFTDATQKSDLLDPAKTQDDLISLLATTVSAGLEPLITSVTTDHADDSALGPHGHAHGYAVDLWVGPSEQQLALAHWIYHNPYVTKVGLGGHFQTLLSEGYVNGTVVFYDNSTEHIHLQTD